MNSKMIFLWPVIISVIGHVALIAVSSMVDLRDNVRAAELFTVQIAEPESAARPEKEKQPSRGKLPERIPEAKSLPEGGREDTVDIGSSDVKYAAYLSGVKQRILHVWKSSDVYKKTEDGVVMITMSLDADGSLAQVSLTGSSGISSVDQKTLDVIRSAAPFRPLPREYDLSRLHIMASFSYRVKE